MRIPIPMRAPVDFFLFPPLVFFPLFAAGLRAVVFVVLPLGWLAVLIFFRGEGDAVTAGLLWGLLGMEEEGVLEPGFAAVVP